MVTFLKILFSILCLYMIYVTVTTSLESNLLKEWSNLAQIPWMAATLKDFYINVTVIFAWVAYKERSVGSKILWLVLLVGLGSIATTAYVLLQLFRLQPGEGIERVLLRRAA